jgi:hypothetical protein
MAGYIRRFLEDPGLEELLAIEGVVIIDREPPATITGLGSGTVNIVGEFEDGVFDESCEVFSSGDLLTQFGGFGFEYDGISSNNPAARARKADGALNNEYWNGNGFIALVNKRFRRLIITRVDTSVGSVEFTRLASVVGNDNFTWDLVPGDSLSIDVDGGGSTLAIFAAVAGFVTSAAGSYPTGFTGGEQMTIVIDGGTANEISAQVVFQASDTLQVDVIARINAALGYTSAADAGGGTTSLIGRQQGTGGSVNITSIDAAVGTATGFSAGSTAGTGDVADINNVTLAEAKSVIEADVTGTFVDRDIAGNIRISSTTVSGATRTVEVDAGTATGFGFTIGELGDAFDGTAGTLPAGSRVRNAGGDEWVTMQSIAIAADEPDDYSVKVRPATDDGTATAAATGTVNVVPFAIPLGSFVVTNPLPLSAALTEAALDAAYLTAFDATKNANNVARETNVIVSARQSNAIRLRTKSNAINSSANGLRGRMGVVRPPLNTSRSVARSGTAQPGVGAYRDQRVIYAYPGARTFVPQIGARGLAGGGGFTVDGRIDVGFDTWVSSVLSQLAPEENPGQLTNFMVSILGLEAGNADVQDMDINDYKAFKRAGIAALRMHEGTAIIQSGKTSVDPAVNPNLQNINRRRMADFIQDTLAVRLNSFSKKLNTILRRKLVIGEIEGFMTLLLSPNNEAAQRIDGYNLDPRSGNTPDTLAAGLYRLILKVRTTPSMDVIVLETVVGESVEVNELPAAA